MKKFKIFLLLSILLCFGFTLSYEVHAQGDGPKLFEVGDVLPAGPVKIEFSYYNTNGDYHSEGAVEFTEQDSITFIIQEDYFEMYEAYVSIIPVFTSNNYSIIDDTNSEDIAGYEQRDMYCYIIIDFSNCTLAERTVISINGEDYGTWEDLNPSPTGYSITFEENGGTSVTDLTEQTALPNPLPIPTKAFHAFAGWYYDNLFIQKANAGDELTGNVILYAKWEQLATNAKVFEVGDILPAGNIKIWWDFTGKPVAEDGTFTIGSNGDLYIEIWEFGDIELYINYEEFYADTPSYTIITLTEPVTITDVDGTSDYNVYIGNALLWEVMPPEYSNGYDNVYDGEQLEIEEGYILPESIIGINLVYNNTGGNKSGSVVITFSDTEYEYGQIIFTAQEDNLSRQVTSAEITVQVNPSPRGWDIYTIDDSLASQTFGSTRGILFAGILLDFRWLPTEARTITDITVEGDLEIDVIFTRILTEEELAYQEGYSNGYITAREIFGWKDGDNWYNGVDAWNLGEKYARELYGFYDSSTDEWLTVSEYVARYGTGGGTGPTGPTDFYNNFDKYFIPALIIVFGGAIVLTILKVFKGRE